MANRKPDSLKARMAKKTRRQVGDLPALKRKLWVGLLHAEDVLAEAEEPELRLKAVHALSQICGQYTKVLEVGEIEARLAALEAQMHGGSRHA